MLRMLRPAATRWAVGRVDGWTGVPRLSVLGPTFQLNAARGISSPSRAATMATAAPPEHGEDVLRVVLKHLGAMTRDATWRFVDAADVSSAALVPQPSEELVVALRNMAARDAQAATVARLACVSSEARRLAAAALPAPARKARHSKAKALADMVAAASDAGLFGEPGVDAALVALCAAAAVPPGAAGDEAAAWRACADAAIGSIDAQPDAEIATFTCFLGGAAETEIGHLPALEDPLEIERNCREWRAERFVAALRG